MNVTISTTSTLGLFGWNIKELIRGIISKKYNIGMQTILKL